MLETKWFDKLSEESEPDAVPVKVSDTTNGLRPLSVRPELVEGPFAIVLSLGAS